MIPFLIIANLPGWTALAQQFDLGLPSDPCVGGLTYTIPFGPPGTTDATLRYGTFTCTFPAPSSTAVVSLGFIEPSVNGAGLRLFRVFANDVLILDQFDTWTACAGYLKPCSRAAVIVPSGPSITLRFVTQLRSAVISSVSIAPLSAAGPPLTFGLGLISVTVPDPAGGVDTEVRIDTTVVQVKQ